MGRKTAIRSSLPDVHYSASATGVAGFTRKLFKRPRKALNKREASLNELPELTDAWFAAVIQQIDEATARLQK